MTTIICLHCSGSSGRQWGRLADAAEPGDRVLAPDLVGYGAAATPLPDADVTLDAAAERIEALVDAARGPVCLVGHSYGAAVATRVALRRHDRVAGLALYEPVLFSLIIARDEHDAAGREILATGLTIRDDVRAGRIEQAAERFVDYWSGEGTWRAMEVRQHEAICARMPRIAQDFVALFGDTVPLAAYTRLAMPVLLLEGETTRRPPVAIARLLAAALPDARWLRVPGAGHMGPITHADAVNAEILGFVRTIDRRQRLGLAA